MNTPSSIRRLRHLYLRKPNSSPAASTTDGITTASPPTVDKDSSSPCRRLRHLYLHKPTSPAAALTSTTDGKYEILVKNFKKNSTFKGFRRNRYMYKSTVGRLAKAGHFDYVHDILDHQKQYPEIQNEHFVSSLICLYGQVKMLDHALQLFDEMPELNCPHTVISFNALMSACLASENYNKAIEHFEELPAKLSVEPNAISFTTVMKAFCKLGLLDKAESVLEEMEKNGVQPDAITFHTLLHEFYSSGRFSEGEKLWNLMREKEITPDLRCYNSRMDGLVKEKKILDAIEVFEEMEKSLKPNYYSYNVFINGFVSEGNVEGAKNWYAKMLENEINPNHFTFNKLIEFSLRENDPDFTFELCKKSVVCLKNKISSKTMQKVINKLVENSKMDKAKELLELLKLTMGSIYGNLSLPSEKN